MILNNKKGQLRSAAAPFPFWVLKAAFS